MTEYDPLSGGAEMPEFHNWARNKGLCYALNYSEAENVWEIEVSSAAPSERMYMKRCSSLRYFMEYWEKERKAVGE